MGAVKHWHAVRPWRQCWLAPGGHRRRPLRLRLWTQRPGCWHSPARGFGLVAGSRHPVEHFDGRQGIAQHYRLQTLQAIDRDKAIALLLARLRAAGVEADCDQRLVVGPALP